MKPNVNCKGVVKYIGCPCWSKGGRVYYGLELARKKGTGNGTKDGVQYFEANMQFALYVLAKHVAAVQPKEKPKTPSDDFDVMGAMREYYGKKEKKLKKSRPAGRSRSSSAPSPHTGSRRAQYSKYTA